MAQPSLRSRRRRTKNEINMVPFIDVMLVLLIIFMVSAPLLPTGVVDLPSIGKARQAPDKVIEGGGGKKKPVTIRSKRGTPVPIDLAGLAERVKDEQDRAAGGPDSAPVIISARKDVRYDAVVQVMDKLQRGGVKRVGLAVRTTGG